MKWKAGENSDNLSYTCPMHPEVVRDAPGMCPECGMTLILARTVAERTRNQAEHTSHRHQPAASPHESAIDKHTGHQTVDFLKKFWIALVLTVPILGYSEIFELAFGFALPKFPGYEWVILALGSVVYFYGGMVFLRGAWREISARLPGMMTLIGLAISAAYLWSVAATIIGEHTLLWELSTLIAIMLLGHWIEMKAVTGARGALKELAKLLPDKAHVLRDGRTRDISLAELSVDDQMLIKPGEKVPTDGEVVEGQSEMNESIITGESRLVPKKAGDEVIAGSINGDGTLTVRVTQIGENTFLSGVMRLVAEAESSKSRLQILSDKAALWLTGIAIFAGGATFISWLVLQAGIVFATERLVAVLVIACPHALGLAVPLVASISTRMAAQNGFLVKRRLALEAARLIDTVLFDKTGTLTKGNFAVMSAPSDDVLALAAAVEVQTEHPIGAAVVEAAKAKGLSLSLVSGFRRVPGMGAEGVVEGKRVFVGHKGGDDIVVEVDGVQKGTIVVADEIRPEAKESINTLHAMGLTIAMVTGDSEEVAKKVSAELGINEYFARVKPGEKSEKVKLLQVKGKKVAFVGDGVNDAPALTQADLGVAIGAGTNVAIESAGIILVRNDPRDIPKIIHLSQLTYGKMIQNLLWATGYNVVAMPLAAGALYAYGILLEPALAAVLMSLSTVIVAINAVLLRKQKI